MTAVDRDAAAIAPLRDIAEVVAADIENGPWPFAGRRFDAVVVTNYLWRDLMPALVDSLSEGGLLLYETFAQGNETVGKPSNPAFLLAPGELLQATRGLHVVAYENGFLASGPSFVQRIAAVKAAVPTARYPLRADPLSPAS